MKNLFVIYIGGAHEKSLIELHDIRFVVADTIEGTYESLKKTWWGTPESLHLDAWGILRYADGHHITLSNQPITDSKNKLYFVNLGGYDKNQFTELHQNIFVVAENEQQAKLKAVAKIQHWESPHRDYLFEAEKMVDVNALLLEQHLYINLQPTQMQLPFEFTCLYTPIGKAF